MSKPLHKNVAFWILVCLLLCMLVIGSAAIVQMYRAFVDALHSNGGDAPGKAENGRFHGMVDNPILERRASSWKMSGNPNTKGIDVNLSFLLDRAAFRWFHGELAATFDGSRLWCPFFHANSTQKRRIFE